MDSSSEPYWDEVENLGIFSGKGWAIRMTPIDSVIAFGDGEEPLPLQNPN